MDDNIHTLCKVCPKSNCFGVRIDFARTKGCLTLFWYEVGELEWEQAVELKLKQAGVPIRK